MTVSGTVALSMVGSITAARIAAGLQLPVECVTLIDGPSPTVAANDSSTTRRLHASTSSEVDARPGAAEAAFQFGAEPAEDHGPRSTQSIIDEAMVTVSFMISPAVNRSGTTSEFIVSSLMTMSDGAQPLWAQPPGVMRMPGAISVAGGA
jgi:hypothetical protein